MDDRRRIPLRWTLAEEEQTAALFPDERAATRHMGTGRYAGMEFLQVNARSIINTVPPASRMPFRHTINAYRGCSHACVYCFARPTHEYLGLDMAEDFERRIVVKVNAVERLTAELRSPRWTGEHIAMGTNTDPYQKAEGKYHLTRGIIGVLGAAANPFSLLTKSTLVLRDLDVLTAAADRTEVRVNLSIATLDRDVWKLTEPGTPPPDQRVGAVRRLNAAGIPTGVLVAPVLPGLSDGEDQLRAVVGACVDAGAVSVTAIGLHLRPGVRDHWMGWLAQARPDLVPLYRSRFANRSYQSDDDQSRLTNLVRALVAEARGHDGGPTDLWRPVGDRTGHPGPAPLDPSPPGRRPDEPPTTAHHPSRASLDQLPLLGTPPGAMVGRRAGPAPSSPTARPR